MKDLFQFDLISKEHKTRTILDIAERENLQIFSEATKGSIKDFKKKIAEIESKTKELESKISDWTATGGVPSEADRRIYDEVGDLYPDHYWTGQHLQSLAEMNIVYLFKCLEISLKSLINTAYPHVKTKGLYQWEEITTLFKSYQIDITNLKGYQDSVDLRKVNNSLKHSDNLSDEIKNMKEFKELGYYDYDNLEAFYNRVKPKIEQFIKEVAQAVVNDLYSFSEDRLNSIAESFVERMDVKTAEKLAHKIIEKSK